MPPSVTIWDPLVRIFHWSLVTSFAAAWMTADEFQDVHEVAGYTVASLLALRLVMGVAGSRYARFTQFVRSPGAVSAYAKSVVANRARRYLGHNPLGGIMVVILIIVLSATAFTGWLQTTGTYWGVEWIQELHEVLANCCLVLIAIHLAGVVFESIRHRENLVVAMVTGRKRRPEPGDCV
ncbi:cytochrome b/b6 domain-containing protein [Rhizobiaceae bacterium n13]|uniref:Cytochrome b/b6 domain-containing protein n=1 Tax=Ferirhizobium litorale TaxID=2927786 RepID=A0AAE3U142_9HYPH|nr:cytochrome b/b6 domain-containing protein [Fererhizobium litorale]MDI7861687.1 cytochrome b/b6 domain-containing protein [Fererhizobium litorale]MDI7921971.1 cytochrome b/b6 domain-containing protein [Fererhizobium litorale]